MVNKVQSEEIITFKNKILSRRYESTLEARLWRVKKCQENFTEDQKFWLWSEAEG